MTGRIALALVLAACSAGRADPDQTPEGSAGGARGSAEVPAAPPPREMVIIANTADALYRVDPRTLDVEEMCSFTFPSGNEARITDISLDRRGRMWGISFETVFRIDPRTCEVVKLADARLRNLNSLAILTAEMAGGGREEPDLLIAGDWNGPILQIDPNDGSQRLLGELGGALGSSGDITWSPEAGAVIVATDRVGYEGLAKMEPVTFKATPIGPGLGGFRHVRGLALIPGGKLLGFTEQGEIIEIDPTTGQARQRSDAPRMFYGAAVGWADTIR